MERRLVSGMFCLGAVMYSTFVVGRLRGRPFQKAAAFCLFFFLFFKPRKLAESVCAFLELLPGPFPPFLRLESPNWLCCHISFLVFF